MSDDSKHDDGGKPGGRRFVTLRRWLIAGILVWAPLAVTFWVVNALISFMDKSILLLPPAYRPEALIGFELPGMGAFFAVVIVLLTGALVANILGRGLIAAWERLLDRIPLVSSIYSAVKQVIETFVSQDSRSFRQVVLVEYPKSDVWVPAYLLNRHKGVCVLFVPTSPNPTSGYTVIVKEALVVPTSLSLEEASSFIISMGADFVKKEELAGLINAYKA